MIFLQAATGNPMSSFIFFGAMLLVIYFFMMRPQMKKQKEQRQFEEELKPGDKIVTASGIVGKVTNLKEKTAIIEVGGKTAMEVTKSAISKHMTDALFAEG